MCVRNNWYWLSKGTLTLDYQDTTGCPAKAFPADRLYFEPILKAMHYLRINRPGNVPSDISHWKSRTMMLSWLVSGYISWLMFSRPATEILVQSADEVRAVEIVDNCKILWTNSSDTLRAKWKVDKDPSNQPYNRFFLANGSAMTGIPGGANKVRSYHPTVYVADEAAIMVDLEDCESNARATRCHQLIKISSANVGYMHDQFTACEEVDWPGEWEEFDYAA